MLTWLRRRREKVRQAEAEARELVAEDRLRAYSEARQRQQDAHSAESFAHYGRVARAVAWLTGKQIGLDTATRMAEEAGFADAEPENPIEELQRILMRQVGTPFVRAVLGREPLARGWKPVR